VLVLSSRHSKVIVCGLKDPVSKSVSYIHVREVIVRGSRSILSGVASSLPNASDGRSAGTRSTAFATSNTGCEVEIGKTVAEATPPFFHSAIESVELDCRSKMDARLRMYPCAVRHVIEYVAARASLPSPV